MIMMFVQLIHRNKGTPWKTLSSFAVKQGGFTFGTMIKSVVFHRSIAACEYYLRKC